MSLTKPKTENELQFVAFTSSFPTSRCGSCHTGLVHQNKRHQSVRLTRNGNYPQLEVCFTCRDPFQKLGGIRSSRFVFVKGYPQRASPLQLQSLHYSHCRTDGFRPPSVERPLLSMRLSNTFRIPMNCSSVNRFLFMVSFPVLLLPESSLQLWAVLIGGGKINGDRKCCRFSEQGRASLLFPAEAEQLTHQTLRQRIEDCRTGFASIRQLTHRRTHALKLQAI